MAQFTLQRLFVAVTTAAIGFALFAYGMNNPSGLRINFVCLLSATLLCAAAGALFKHAFNGALAGAVIGVTVLLIVDMYQLLNR